VALAVFVFLVGELRISAAELVIGDVAVDLLFVQILHVSFIGKASVGGHDGAFLVDVLGDAQLLKTRFYLLQNWLQGMMLLAFAEGLSVNDDLVLFIHRGYAVIALDRALAGGHFGTFVIGQIALHFLDSLPPAHPWAVRL